MTDLATDPAPRFDCPRCQAPATEVYYGPCQRCRDELRQSLGSRGRAVAPTEYEPKLNVTPNAVALKDD